MSILFRSKLKQYRHKKLYEQDGKCAIFDRVIESDNATADHDPTYPYHHRKIPVNNNIKKYLKYNKSITDEIY